MQNEKKKTRILSDLAFQEDIEDGGIEIPSTLSPFGISTITKSTASVGF